MDTKLDPSKTVLQANTNPEQLSLPREMNCSRASIDSSGFDPNASEVLRRFPLFEHSWFRFASG